MRLLRFALESWLELELKVRLLRFALEPWLELELKVRLLCPELVLELCRLGECDDADFSGFESFDVDECFVLPCVFNFLLLLLDEELLEEDVVVDEEELAFDVFFLLPSFFEGVLCLRRSRVCLQDATISCPCSCHRSKFA